MNIKNHFQQWNDEHEKEVFFAACEDCTLLDIYKKLEKIEYQQKEILLRIKTFK